MTGASAAAPWFGVPRGAAYTACCAVAALNARFYIMAASATDAGAGVAALRLFNVSALVWFALFAAWSITRQGGGQSGAWQRGDAAVLTGTLLASLLPFPFLAAVAGLLAPLWLCLGARRASSEWRAGLVLAAVGLQLIGGRLFLLLFGDVILWADTALVGWAAATDAAGNMLTRPDGTNLIVSSGCSSVHNVSLALLGWVALVQLVRLRTDRRLLVYVAASVAAMIALNAARIVSLAWFPEHFDMLHHGTGGAMFGWAALLVFAAIAAAGVIDAADRGQRAAMA